ncbi:MAG: FUSC family protein [Legionellaceae bacterium]|nr:FUSC family protein [Legionellaceae bacterium]
MLTALQMMCSVSLSYFLAQKIAMYLHFSSSLISGLWAGISSIMIMQVEVQEVHNAGYFRILGSSMGAICAVLCAMSLGYSAWTIAITMFVSTIMVSLCSLKKTLRLTNLTALVIIVVGIISPEIPPWKNAIARVLESALGVSVTIMLAWLFHPIRKKYDLFQKY